MKPVDSVVRVRRKMALDTAMNGASALAPQVIALLSLSPVDFGRFSLAYLCFALANSLVLSIVCDTWSIAGQPQARDWTPYTHVLTLACCVFSVVSGAVVLLVTRDIAFSGMSVVCLAAALYVMSLRFFVVRLGDWRSALRCDAAQLLVMTSSYVSLYFYIPSLWALMIAWGLGCMVGGCCYRAPRVDPAAGYRWVTTHRGTIWPLTVDSLVMNASGIGTPFLLLPFLGIQDFGLYRAVSNVSAPVRLLLAPLRPSLLNSPGKAMSARMNLIMMASSLALGLAATGALFVIGWAEWTLGTLSDLQAFAIPTGLYVASSVALSYYPVLCRICANARVLALGRGIQTICGIALPVAGYAVGQLAGAIWGFALASLASAVAWYLVTARGLTGRERVDAHAA